MSIEPCQLCKKQCQKTSQSECLFCFIPMENICDDCIIDCICTVCLGIDVNPNNLQENHYFNSEIFSRLEDDEMFSDSNEVIASVDDEIRNNIDNVELTGPTVSKMIGSENQDEDYNPFVHDHISKEVCKNDMIRFHDEPNIVIDNENNTDCGIQSKNPFDNNSSSEENIMKSVEDLVISSSTASDYMNSSENEEGILHVPRPYKTSQEIIDESKIRFKNENLSESDFQSDEIRVEDDSNYQFQDTNQNSVVTDFRQNEIRVEDDSNYQFQDKNQNSVVTDFRPNKPSGEDDSNYQFQDTNQNSVVTDFRQNEISAEMDSIHQFQDTNQNSVVTNSKPYEINAENEKTSSHASQKPENISSVLSSDLKTSEGNYRNKNVPFYRFQKNSNSKSIFAIDSEISELNQVLKNDTLNKLLNLSETEFNKELEKALDDTEAIKKQMEALNQSVSVTPITVTTTDLDIAGFHFPAQNSVPNNTPVTQENNTSLVNSSSNIKIEEPTDTNSISTLNALDIDNEQQNFTNSLMNVKYVPKTQPKDPKFIENLSKVNQLTGEIENIKDEEPKHFPLTLEKRSGVDGNIADKMSEDGGKNVEPKKVNNLIAYYESLNGKK